MIVHLQSPFQNKKTLENGATRILMPENTGL